MPKGSPILAQKWHTVSNPKSPWAEDTLQLAKQFSVPKYPPTICMPASVRYAAGTPWQAGTTPSPASSPRKALIQEDPA